MGASLRRSARLAKRVGGGDIFRPWRGPATRSRCAPRPRGRSGRDPITTCDFLVIGGGIAGATAADALSVSGRVLLLEREDAFGVHTTGRSAAMFIETYGNACARAITRASRDFYFQPIDDFAPVPLVRRRGILQFATAEDWPWLRAEFETLRQMAPRMSVVDAKTCAALAPTLREGHAVGGLFSPDTADLDVDAIHQGFLRRARRRGADIRAGVGVLRGARADGAWRVETSDGMIEAGVVVNAAGAWGDEVARDFGVQPIGLEPRRRTAFLFGGAGVMAPDAPVVMDAHETFYFKATAGQILGSACDATPSPPMDAWPHDLDVAEGIARIEAATTLTIGRPSHAWAGLRTFAPDASPVVGRDPDAPDFVWYVGQGGYGIQTAPAMGRILAAMIETGAPPPDVGALGVDAGAIGPARFRAR